MTTPDTLPPLPLPACPAAHTFGLPPYYTAEQMHAYARAAIAERDAEIERLRAEVAAWRATASDTAHALESARMWDGMKWHYQLLHPFHYKPALEKLRAALEAAHAAGE